jgi:hypothetical protein
MQDDGDRGRSSVAWRTASQPLRRQQQLCALHQSLLLPCAGTIYEALGGVVAALPTADPNLPGESDGENIG